MIQKYDKSDDTSLENENDRVNTTAEETVANNLPILDRFLFTLTPQLKATIDVARGDYERCAWIENLLWNTPTIASAAESEGITRKPRRRHGEKGEIILIEKD